MPDQSQTPLDQKVVSFTVVLYVFLMVFIVMYPGDERDQKTGIGGYDNQPSGRGSQP